jgi:hypothetical protein
VIIEIILLIWIYKVDVEGEINQKSEAERRCGEGDFCRFTLEFKVDETDILEQYLHELSFS